MQLRRQRTFIFGIAIILTMISAIFVFLPHERDEVFNRVVTTRVGILKRIVALSNGRIDGQSKTRTQGRHSPSSTRVDRVRDTVTKSVRFHNSPYSPANNRAFLETRNYIRRQGRHEVATSSAQTNIIHSLIQSKRF